MVFFSRLPAESVYEHFFRIKAELDFFPLKPSKRRLKS
jgi:hypothetical protein